MSSIVHPLHYTIVEHQGTTWLFRLGDIFYNPRNAPTAATIEDQLHRFNLTPQQVLVELFRLNGGKSGYYLVNMREKQYYYCGAEFESVGTVLQSLGIGRSEGDRCDS